MRIVKVISDVIDAATNVTALILKKVASGFEVFLRCQSCGCDSFVCQLSCSVASAIPFELGSALRKYCKTCGRTLELECSPKWVDRVSSILTGISLVDQEAIELRK